MKILFLHGWQSVPGGVKPTFLASHGHEVINPALPDEDFDSAVQIAQAEFDKHQPAVVVGSSRCVERTHVSEVNITGRAMKGWVLVESEGIEDDDQLNAWIRRGVNFVGKLPAK